MLWIALHFPDISLEAVNRAGGAIGSEAGDTLIHALPLVVTDGPESRPVLYAANAAARELGLGIGTTLASARALEASLMAIPRDPQKEAACLRLIAAWTAQFTPAVAIEAQSVVIEVSGSLQLFGGIARLIALIRKGMVAMGHHALIGVAPTPLAATVLARASQYQAGIRMCREPAQLRERLADIPLPLFAWPHGVLHALSTLGFTRVKDLLVQPREGLRRRFGELVLNDLDRALGMQPDPRPYYILPERFHSELELVFEIGESERLLHPLGAILTGMEGFLRARGAGVTGIAVSLKHSRDVHTHLHFATRTPAREAGHWLRLIRERFAMTTLDTAVVALCVSAEKLLPFSEENESFLPAADGAGKKWDGLVDRLASRLGEANVFTVEAHDDHRPEAAWQLGPSQRRSVMPCKKSRPAWLLREPRALTTLHERPQHHGALSLLAGPERIESGWWDGRPVMRDYFVARNPQHEVCWVFRDYRHGKRWFLHGLFA